MKRFIAPLLVLFIASTAFAQQGPPPPQSADQNQQDEGGSPPPPPPGGMNRRGGGMMMGGNRGPGQESDMMEGPGRGHMPPMSERMRTVEMLRGYLDLVDRYTRLSSNATSAGVAAVVTAGDILKARGKDAAIDYFNKVLPDVKDPTVERAIHLQLADLYKTAGESDKALDQLHMLMIEQAPEAQPAPPKSQ